MHGACDGVVFGEVRVGGRVERRESVDFIDRDFAGAPDAQAAPSFYLMPVSEDGVLLFVLTAVDWKTFSCFPAPDRAFAAIEVGGDLLPRFQSLLRGVSQWHPKTPAEDYTTGSVAEMRCHACQ
jgi:hypothetical protein